MAKDLVKVKFKKQWRGHDKEAVADLTPERADELIEGGYCDEVKPEVKRRAQPAPQPYPPKKDFSKPSGE